MKIKINVIKSPQKNIIYKNKFHKKNKAYKNKFHKK